LKENYTFLAFAPKSPKGDFLKHVDLLIVTISHFRGLGLFFQKEGVFFQTLCIKTRQRYNKLMGNCFFELRKNRNLYVKHIFERMENRFEIELD